MKRGTKRFPVIWLNRLAVAGLAVWSSALLAQDKPTIQALENAFAENFNKADARAIGDAYTDDAQLVAPDTDIIVGQAAIESFWGGATQNLTDLKLTVVDVSPLGPDAAREIGRVSMKTRAQPTKTLSGKYVVVWRKTPEGWKISTDTYSLDK